MSDSLATYVKLEAIDGMLYAKSDGLVAVLQINFTGDIKVDDITNDSCIISVKNNIIVAVMTKKEKMPEKLFMYEGEFIIESAKAASWDAKYIDVIKTPQIVDFADNIEETFDTMSDPENYNVDYTVGMKQEKTTYMKKNLYTSGGQYYYDDGTEYVGKYHLHDNFQAMTGSEHSDQAINIYLKDGNNRLFKPNEVQYRKAIKKSLRAKNG